jgi:hypothetical protein
MTTKHQQSTRPAYDLNKLRTYNLLMALLHFAQAAIIIVLGWGKGLTVPITTDFLRASKTGGPPAPTPATLGSFRLGSAIAVFLLLSAIAHLVTVLPGVFRWYKANLGRGINYIRWYEYALSSSVMIVIIAELSGMYDLPSTIMIFFLNAAMNLFGLLMELHNQTTVRTNWTAFAFGCVVGIVPWVVICLYFFSAAASATGTIPASSSSTASPSIWCCSTGRWESGATTSLENAFTFCFRSLRSQRSPGRSSSAQSPATRGTWLFNSRKRPGMCLGVSSSSRR